MAVTVAQGVREDWEQRLLRDVQDADRELVIAHLPHHDSPGRGRVIGYARLGLVAPQASRRAPSGYYVLGLVVEPASRRQGVGEALLQQVVAVARERAHELWSFYDIENTASVALHAGLGFLPQHRGKIGFPGLPGTSHDELVRLALRPPE